MQLAGSVRVCVCVCVVSALYLTTYNCGSCHIPLVKHLVFISTPLTASLALTSNRASQLSYQLN